MPKYHFVNPSGLNIFHFANNHPKAAPWVDFWGFSFCIGDMPIMPSKEGGIIELWALELPGLKTGRTKLVMKEE